MNENEVLLRSVKMADVRYDRTMIPLPAYYPNECFARCYKYPEFLIGNMGTIYDMKNNIKICAPARLYNNNPDNRNVHIRDENGNTVIDKLSRVIMRAHNPEAMENNNIVFFKDANNRNSYYNPYDNDNNNLKAGSLMDKTHNSIRNGNQGKANIYDDATIHSICQMAINGMSSAQIANQLGYDPKKISEVVRKMRAGKYRRDIVSQYPPIPNMNGNITEEVVRYVCALLKEGLSPAKVANIAKENGYSISMSTVYDLKKKSPRYSKWLPIVEEYGI